MLGKIFDRILKDEEEEFEIESGGQKEERKAFSWKELVLVLIIFLLSLISRLYFLFTHDPQNAGVGWYGDVYHHWQIAYLSKEVGFSHGFLRLWDLKGMEFFWGLTHPLVLIGLFSIFGSVDILVPRLLSIFCGSLVSVLIFLLVKRDFNQISAFACSLWAIFFPVILFSDTLGMQEQLGLFFLLGGVFFWPKFGWLTGILWALASMTRAEYWLFAAALTFFTIFDPRRNISGAKISLILAYIFPVIFYMKYLWQHTGNAIFPIWWNYLASVVGKWFVNVSEPLNEVQILGQWFGRILFVFGLVGSIITIIKRPRFYLFFLTGFFNVCFIGFIFGFAAYIHGFFERFWFDRLLAFPYLFLGILLIIFLLFWLPKYLLKIYFPALVFGFLIFLFVLLASQLIWFKILFYFQAAQEPYQRELEIAKLIAENDLGGNILFPADRPALTYALVRNHNISGKRLISEMYDPYYYRQEGETLEETEEKVISWLRKEGVNLIVYTGKREYETLFENHPEKFKLLVRDSDFILYEFF